MNDVELRQQALLELERLSYEGHAAITIATLAARVGAPAKRVAIVAASLVRHGQVIGDGDMMGFVGISAVGRQYLAGVRELADSP